MNLLVVAYEGDRMMVLNKVAPVLSDRVMLVTKRECYRL